MAANGFLRLGLRREAILHTNTSSSTNLGGPSISTRFPTRRSPGSSVEIAPPAGRAYAQPAARRATVEGSHRRNSHDVRRLPHSRLKIQAEPGRTRRTAEPFFAARLLNSIFHKSLATGRPPRPWQTSTRHPSPKPRIVDPTIVRSAVVPAARSKVPLTSSIRSVRTSAWSTFSSCAGGLSKAPDRAAAHGVERLRIVVGIGVVVEVVVGSSRPGAGSGLPVQPPQPTP